MTSGHRVQRLHERRRKIPQKWLPMSTSHTFHFLVLGVNPNQQLCLFQAILHRSQIFGTPEANGLVFALTPPSPKATAPSSSKTEEVCPCHIQGPWTGLKTHRNRNCHHSWITPQSLAPIVSHSPCPGGHVVDLQCQRATQSLKESHRRNPGPSKWWDRSSHGGVWGRTNP